DHLAAKRGEIARDIAGTARHCALACLSEHGYRRLRRHALDAAIDIAVEHHVAQHEGADPRQTLNQVLIFAHTKPNSRSSPAHSIWPSVMCISWMRAVVFEGTINRGSAIPGSRPPSPPANAAATRPSSLAVSSATITFGLRPLVVIPRATSPARPSAS